MQLQTNVNMPHSTPPNPMSNVACTSDATSNQRQHAPLHPTQPYVQRSVHIRCNFKPTSTCPTPPHPDPYQLMWVEARTDTTSHQAQLKCNQALSNQSFPSETLTWPKRVDNIAMGSLTEALAKTTISMVIFNSKVLVYQRVREALGNHLQNSKFVR